MPFDERRFTERVGEDAPLEYDAVSFFFSLYMLKKPKEFSQAMSNAFKLAKEDGYVLIFDGVNIYQDGRMHFIDNRRPFGCSLWACQKSKMSEGFKRVLTVDSGRAQIIKPEKALYDMPGAEKLGLK
jgi:hypothetical protein